MTTLQDIMGLIIKRKIKTPTDNDYIISAAYTDIYERLKPQPKMEPNLLSLGAIKAYIGSGSQGPPGAAATIAIGTTTTGAAGTSAIVTNVGTSSAAIFDFTIPEGEQGPQGPQGPQGLPGTGSSCPDHFKLAAVSGIFNSGENSNSPDIANMFSGNSLLGWSYGNYDADLAVDGFGNLQGLSLRSANCGIPLSVDLNVGDTVKISGIAYIGGAILIGLTNPKFYITVSRFSCLGMTEGSQLSTVIPVATYPLIPQPFYKVCFSELVTLGTILPADQTFFVVGMTVGSDSHTAVDVRFSYTLDVTQACIGTGSNYLIRNCCDPAYTEVIIDNGVPVGGSFLDDEGNCWTIDSETLNSVTGIRTKVSEYSECNACIIANPCPENLVVDSCCYTSEQFFSGALPGVNVGDTFVDTNGYCWSVTGTTPAPITNTVTVGTAYPASNCESAECIDANVCPTPVLLDSCCKLGRGNTTLEILQSAVPSLALGDYFVDTFGFCWSINSGDATFPDLSFITPASEQLPCEEIGGCDQLNPCPDNLYYTIQNCCTEEIEVFLGKADTPINRTLLLQLTTGFGCYKILSWSDTGIATVEIVDVLGVTEDCKECAQQLLKRYDAYCVGKNLCCTLYENMSDGESGFVTGYRCDGTWIVDYEVLSGQRICMAQIVSISRDIIKDPLGCCSFDILNPSLTLTMGVTFAQCNGYKGSIDIPPNTLLSTALGNHGYLETCVRCVEKVDDDGNNFIYVECNL